MVFTRGQAEDYDHWAQLGNKGWSFQDVLPYFKKMENCLAGGDAYRGDHGPLELERGPGVNPLFGAFLKSVQDAGYELTDDVNGEKQEGFALFDRNVRKGKRLSAARAYYHPVKKRPNLELLCQVHTTKILFLLMNQKTIQMINLTNTKQ